MPLKNSKKGKLTPGLYVQEQNLDELLDRFKESEWYLIESVENKKENTLLSPNSNSIVFFFGFEGTEISNERIEKCLLNSLEIDEQAIIINYIIESVK